MTSDELRSEGDEKKVTVIVTIYNLEDYIEECLLSLMNQKYKNLEIVVDANSIKCEFGYIVHIVLRH
jgi:cellulose synthase/poly-beta-1,6-N-acetylglucosamine synthase-like glycosyltransferase